MRENPSHFTGNADLPVESVPWRMVDEMYRTLTDIARTNGLLERGEVFRLPTEAEWEYACRAGTDTAFNDGSPCVRPEGKDPALDRLGWFLENSGGQTHPVGEKAPNAWGLYDMHGNVLEWCLDDRRPYDDQPQVDPIGPMDQAAGRALRGGSCWDVAGDCRSAYRGGDDPGLRDGDFGFRLAAGQPPRSGQG